MGQTQKLKTEGLNLVELLFVRGQGKFNYNEGYILNIDLLSRTNDSNKADYDNSM